MEVDVLIEANQVADRIVNMTQSDSKGINMFVETPSNFIENLATDKSKGLFQLIIVV